MIISKIRGGLGNQLFQWAAGYALAKKHKVVFLLDLSVFSRNFKRNFLLDGLFVPYSIANEKQVEFLKEINFYRQPFYHYDPMFAHNPKQTFLRGYFCSQKYFAGAEKEIGKLLAKALSKNELDNKQQRLLEKIESVESVSIHVRRGDYVDNPDYNEFFGVCSLEYYFDAINQIKEMLFGKDLVFVVFSDDLDWARENLKFTKNVIYVDQNAGKADHFDMLFMAQCKHNIIANSTYSWWAAWINQHEDKIVLWPSKWFARNFRERTKGAWIQSQHYDISDINPLSWYKVSSS